MELHVVFCSSFLLVVFCQYRYCHARLSVVVLIVSVCREGTFYHQSQFTQNSATSVLSSDPLGALQMLLLLLLLCPPPYGRRAAVLPSVRPSVHLSNAHSSKTAHFGVAVTTEHYQ